LEIGSFIRAHRKKLGLTQVQLANALSYDNYQMISNIERGLAPLPKLKISKMAELLQVSEQAIFETTFKGQKLGADPDVRMLFERGASQQSSVMSITIDREEEPEFYRIVTKFRKSRKKDKFIRIATILLDID